MLIRDIPPQLLQQIMAYDPETGALVWKERPLDLCKSDRERRRWNTRHAGKPACFPRPQGYLGCLVYKVPISAHRAAWALHYGEWPNVIDHINGDRADNRIANLRSVDKAENAKNRRMHPANKSGALGVIAHRKGWRAYITHKYQQIHLGVFPTKDEAIAARREAEAKYGFHANHGSDPQDRRAA